tara:strand:+ start:1624 stop:2139 length:516 start_codon:yes stop_codon:yes gene_type:complete
MSNDFLNELVSDDVVSDEVQSDDVVNDELLEDELEDEFEDEFEDLDEDLDEVEEVYASEWHTTSALVLIGSYLVLLLFWWLGPPNDGKNSLDQITSARLPADVAVFVLITSGFSFLCSVIGMIADWYCKRDLWSMLVTFGPLLPLALLALGGVSIATEGTTGTLFTEILRT